jgi:hypothetical protein
VILVERAIFVEVPLQIVCDKGEGITLGVGVTVTSKLKGIPGQLVDPGPVGVIIYRTTPGDVPVLFSVGLILAPQLELQFENPVIVPPTGTVIIDAVQLKVVPVVAEVIV